MNSKQQQSETHPLFPSGEWEGFYTYAFGPSANRNPMQFFLDFHQEKIHGGGADEVGAFSWKGNYDTETATCLMTKFYLGKHAVVYDGHADENGIWGTWMIPPFMKGGFHIWPKQKGGENKATEAVETKIQRSTDISLHNPR